MVTGRFFGGSAEDFLAYYPGGANPGGAGIIRGAGDGTMLDPYVSGNQASIDPSQLADPNGNSPLELVNAFVTDGNDNGLPDLIGRYGDPVRGYGLGYLPSFGAPGLYLYGSTLTNPTPTGGTDWQNWSITSTQLSSGTAIFLRNATSGGLYLWTGVTLVDNGDGTGSLAHTQYQVAANWNTGVAISTLWAADINVDGTPDLWTVLPDGTSHAYLISGLTSGGTATVTAIRAQRLA
ncbi:hypothetical protein [Micromonospora sp. IBHARD004]|uniref:hypothetical protein n=1 Tax=Micromonospora sp. IBHARD004 TaxID=3457764 RepID=UPI004057D0C7